MSLTIPTEGCCKGHPCDNCKICQSGRCCRRDNPNYKLPELGEWDGPIYGELGVLNDDGDKVECHCCGEWYSVLAPHIWHKHDLNTQEYKAIFGFNRGFGLSSQKVKHKARCLPSLYIGDKAGLGSIAFTPEQLSENAKKPRRLSHFKNRDPETYLHRRQGHSYGNTSGYVGVISYKTRWDAQITFHGKRIWLGRFDIPKFAARAYDAKARELYGDKARLNFPDE